MLTLAAIGSYIAIGGLLIATQVGSPALRLTRTTQPALGVLSELVVQQQLLEAPYADLRRIAQRSAPPDRDHLDSLLQGIDPARLLVTVSDLSGIPTELRNALIGVDSMALQLQQALVDGIVAAELGRGDDLRRHLAASETLRGLLVDGAGRAQVIALAFLVDRETSLSQAAARALRLVALWAFGGVAVLPFLLWLVRRMVGQPLHALEGGIARVADGDIEVELAVSREDEIGRIARHFNVMSAALRQRVEGHARLVAGGELLAAVAHEIKNPLMAITALARTVSDQQGTGPEQRRDLGEISRQVRRASTLTHTLLRFVRRHEVTTIVPTNIAEVIAEALALVDYQFGVDDITFTFVPPTPPIWVTCDPPQLEQVIVNLLGNALAALRTVAPPRRLAITAWKDGVFGCVAVEDAGPGIPPDLLDTLFRPFRSTHRAERTGLGLYISRRLLEASGGTLVHEIRPGPGARFVVRLPVCEAPVASGAAVDTGLGVAGARPPRLDGVTVLVVDDEAAICRPVGRYLKALGATVHEARDGVEALEVLEGIAPHVLLVDFRMPRLNGVELFRAVQRVRPELVDRFLFLSGDLGQLAEPDVPVPPHRLLAKPVELADLADRVFEVARASAAPP